MLALGSFSSWVAVLALLVVVGAFVWAVDD
jgi:hypothetical protein